MEWPAGSNYKFIGNPWFILGENAQIKCLPDSIWRKFNQLINDDDATYHSDGNDDDNNHGGDV